MIQMLIGFIVPTIIYMIIWYLVKKENERVWSPSEIIDYIARYYTIRTRSLSTQYIGYCKYTNENGKHCAFALICINPYSLLEGQTARELIRDNGIDIIKSQFRLLSLNSGDFYIDLQLLHDVEANWNEFGLSEKGEDYVKSLKSKYK